MQEVRQRFRARRHGGSGFGATSWPYKRITCPACGKGGWFNVYSSVKEPVTWPPEEKKAAEPEQQLSEEELEKKRIEESKYEST